MLTVSDTAYTVATAGFATFEPTTHDLLWRRHLSGEPHPVAPLMSIGIARTEP